MVDSYIDPAAYYSNYQMLLEAMNKLPVHPEFFLEWLLEVNAALYINLMELVVITRTIHNVFEQVFLRSDNFYHLNIKTPQNAIQALWRGIFEHTGG